MNCIKIELCAEDRARLDRLAEALERSAGQGHDCSKCVEQAIDFVERSKAEAVPAETPAPAPVPDPVPAADDMPWEEAPTPSLAEFQKALSLRCAESADMKAKVRALLNQYAAAASAVPPEKRAEILAKLEVLK